MTFLCETAELTPVRPVKPAAAYFGGKCRLAKTIIEHIGAIPHDAYAEPFVGMGGVFLRRSARPRAEIINDLSGDVANFFRVLQRHYIPFTEMLRFQLSGRLEFMRLAATDPKTLTDLERAARFLYLQRLGFAGKIVDRAFAIKPDKAAYFDTGKLAPILADLHERLSGVVIECLPYQEFILRYDRPGTLFYLDPPYFGREKQYEAGLFERKDFAALADLLRALKGRFILSLNDTPEVRKLFKGFHIASVPVTYNTNSATKRTHELLIANTALA
ncbi:MAG: DNA adenine methylase [Pseudomonadota bacterium]